ncbi:MAG: dihydrodipicolinate synthase family protein [Planctomycetota bacterium]|nr:MAG: dihydrodipicolinate synthase family protein [Planctomycetota bacterium]
MTEMDTCPDRPWLRGIVVPLVTPLRDRDAIDHAGLERLIERLVASGVHGIFALGTTGEAPSLSYRLRRELIEHTCRLAAGRVPVLIGITDTSMVESIELGRFAGEAGADAVVASTPFYFPAGQTELRQYLRGLAAELPLPLMIYNMPSLTKLCIEPKTIEELIDVPNIRGVKDSGGDLDYFRRVARLKQQRPDWSILIGPEHLLVESLALGGDGGVHGGANIFPRLFVDLFSAADCGDSSRVAQLSRIVGDLQAIYAVGKYDSRFVKATKCALSVLGICSDRMAEPLNRFLAPERQRVAEVLGRIAIDE